MEEASVAVHHPSPTGDLWEATAAVNPVALNPDSIEEMELTDIVGGNHVGNRAPSIQLKAVRPSVKSLHCISFHDITYEVTQRKCCKRLPNKVILNSVSGLMLPGLNAIMGPTGSGKTSLLDVMADRKDKSGLTGTVLINGRKKPPNFKCMVGYVVQDDVVMGTLSVRENLHFSAALRLPSKMSYKQRKERVEKVIDELGLRSCASTKVGTEFLRGVSGGERKRTNIGMELIIEPGILFLDEPTTGLDAFTAVSVVQLLKDLSRASDRIVVMSIHQPRYAIFKLFDSLTLLSLGNLVYHGSAQKSLQYFDQIGYTCEEHENPADYFLDVINRCEKMLQEKEKENEEDPEKGSKTKVGDNVDLATVFRQSSEYQEVRNVIDPILEGRKKDGDLNIVTRKFAWFGHPYPTSFFWQLLMVMLRSAVNLIRNPGTSILQIFTLTLFGIVIGALYFQIDADSLGLMNRLGVFFFVATNQAFGSLSAIELFIKQRALFIHEAASGYYGVLPFFIAKVTLDLFAIRLIPNIIFSVITYFMVGFQLVVSKFFIYFVLVTMTSVSAVSVAFCISAATRVAGIANLLIAMVFVVSMLFGGLLIALESLPVWLHWLKYLSFVRYSVEGMAINEMDGLTFPCPVSTSGNFSSVMIPPVMMNNTSMMNSSSTMFEVACSVDGLTGLSRLGYETDWLPWDVLALVVYSLIFLFFAYIILVLIKKEK